MPATLQLLLLLLGESPVPAGIGANQAAMTASAEVLLLREHEGVSGELAVALQGGQGGGPCGRGLFVENGLQPLLGQVQRDPVAMLKAAVDDASEVGAGAEVLRGGKTNKGERVSEGQGCH